jgi:TRAP-type C4-dicarboxylate transport system permease small subunit
VLDRFCRLLDLTSALALALMAAMVFGNVVLRYGFNSGIAVSEELSRWLFVWMTFLGATVALKENGHLGSDMLVSRLGRGGKLACMALSQLLMLGCTVMLFQGSLAQVKINLDVEAPVTGWSMAVVYAAGIAFAVPAGLLLLYQLGRTVSGRVSDQELVMVQESEDLAQLQHGEGDRK